MRTEILVIVFTDIKGYTATTSSQSYLENARLLRRVERIIAPVVKAYNGRVIKSIGDAYMIVFRSPTEAVRCATAVQDRLHQHNAGSSPDDAIHIRVAMNIGEVRVHRGDVFGEPVNIAARIESVTPADEIYFSEAVYLTMNRSDILSEEVGEYELKGIPEPVTLYKVRRYTHLDEAQKLALEEEDDESSSPRAADLPFGGTQLGHWHRMLWVRRAYVTLWVLAVVGLSGAAYLRYRPTADYDDLVAGVKNAISGGDPIEALALAGQIPDTASQERTLVRRDRHRAVAMLLEEDNLVAAKPELASLLREDGRDAESLLLQGMLIQKEGTDHAAAMDSLEAALRISAGMRTRVEVIDTLVLGYAQPTARKAADRIVSQHLKQEAIPGMVKALSNGFGDRVTRTWLANRLEKLGAGDEVDWVGLAIEDVKSTSCKVRKAAIIRLMAEGDERSVGPLLKLAESKGSCHALYAKRAVDSILSR